MPTNGIQKLSIDRRGAAKLSVALALACATLNDGSANADDAAAPRADLTRKPVPRLRPGIVIGQHHQYGYSTLVTMVHPRLASGHIDSLPEFSRTYASMFKYTLLANVAKHQAGGGPIYLLDKVGVGFAMDVQGQTTVVTHDTANDLGADLGFIDRGVLSGNEDCLDDVIQIARTDGMILFDALANMLVGGTHQQRVVRHLLWVSPDSGRIGFLVWMLNDTGSDRYQLASPTMQLLPAGFQEDRKINVSEGGFLSKIPTPDRFALVTIPQGTPTPFSARMKSVAGKQAFTEADLQQLVQGTSESLALVRVARK